MNFSINQYLFNHTRFIWLQDKTYEEGIINNLRALELRLECELAEEEEKLWPLQDKEQA